MSTPQDLTSDGKTLPQFSKVQLLRNVVFHGFSFPRGSKGTIVEIHAGGAGYEVEFSVPAEEVVGVHREDLLAI